MVAIKIKPFNIFLLALAFLASFVVVHGTCAEIDENSIYILENLHGYKKAVDDIRTIVDSLKKEIESENKKIELADNKDYFDEIIRMNNEIKELKLYNGFSSVRGPGIMLSVSDSKSEDVTVDVMEKIVHDVDITVLINDLRNAGAEAIDVNNKRIINISEVVCAGPLLKINGYVVPAPFIIKAIGDQEALYNAVNDVGTYAYELKHMYDMEVSTMRSDYLTVPMFRGRNYEIKYSEILE